MLVTVHCMLWAQVADATHMPCVTFTVRVRIDGAVHLWSLPGPQGDPGAYAWCEQVAWLFLLCGFYVRNTKVRFM